MFKFLKKILPNLIIDVLVKIKQDFFDGHSFNSYSQEGEDMILRRIFDGQSRGFYVDVGAHHPKRFSNTYFFYKMGWAGINIDAMPGSMRLFKKVRSRDINLEKAVSSEKKIMTYYQFNEPGLNGFSKELSQSRDGLRQYKIIATKEIESSTLAEILDDHLPPNTFIDFFSIDVEGFDLEVLKSNNWEKYKPKIVLIEVLDASLHNLAHHEISLFLEKLNYEIFAKCFRTVVFKQQNA